MNIHTLDERYIGTQFPCALEYGDVTGLDDNEEELLDDWVSEYTSEATAKYGAKDPVLHFEYGEQSEFETCSITGLKGNCVKVWIQIIV